MDRRDVSVTAAGTNTLIAGLSIDEQIAALRERKRHEQALEHQRKVVRPQIEARRDRLQREAHRLQTAANEAADALRQIDAGELTEYRVRAPRGQGKRQRKAAE